MDTLEQLDVWKRFFRPAEVASWVAVSVGVMLVALLPLGIGEYMNALFVGGLVLAYNVFFFRWLVPNFGSSRLVPYVGQVGSIALVTAAVYLLEHHGIHAHLLYVIVVAVAGILSGWRPAILAALLAAIAYELGMGDREVTWVAVLAGVFHFLIFLMAGYLTSSLTGVIRQQGRTVSRRNRDLALLLDTVATASASLDLDATMPLLAEKLAKGIARHLLPHLPAGCRRTASGDPWRLPLASAHRLAGWDRARLCAGWPVPLAGGPGDRPAGGGGAGRSGPGHVGD